jgi:hypothetical protein
MELIYKMFPVVTSALFSLGGSGWKWARRYVLPFAVYLITKNLWVSGILCVAFHLPYGDSVPEAIKWVYRFIVMCSYYLPFLLIRFTPWAFISPVIAFGLFYASNQKWGEKWSPHWIFEPSVGFLLGVTCTDSLH